MDADAKCVQANAGRKVGTDNVLINADGTIQNVIVYVSAGLEGKKFDTPAAKATINQVGCMYVPHVQTVMISQVVTIINSDPTMHNIHSLAKKSREFNFAQPNPGDRRDVSFARPEFVKIKCDVHPWMSAFVGVFDHPHHAVTDKKGVCVLELPPGAYELSAWHEELGEAKPQKVNIKAGEMLNLTFEFEQE
jgi:plastocyanin